MPYIRSCLVSCFRGNADRRRDPPFLRVFSQLSLYMSLAPEQKLTYPLAGPAGPAAFNAGMAGFEAQTFRGLGVFTSTPVSFVLELHTAHLNALEPFL